MAEARVERRLAAILAADIAGYSRLIGSDEEGTLASLRAVRREVIDPSIAEHRGRIVKTTGDGFLIEFQSVLDALRCAARMQRELAERNQPVAAERRMEFPDRHSPGRHRRRGRRYFRRRRQHRRPARGDSRARRDLCLGAGAGRRRRPARYRVRGSWRTGAEEHRPPGAGVSCQAALSGLRPRRLLTRRDGDGGTGRRDRRSAAAFRRALRQTLDRGAAVSEHVGRSGTRVFRRRHGRGDHHGVEPGPLALRHGPQFGFHL